MIADGKVIQSLFVSISVTYFIIFMYHSLPREANSTRETFTKPPFITQIQHNTTGGNYLERVYKDQERKKSEEVKAKQREYKRFEKEKGKKHKRKKEKEKTQGREQQTIDDSPLDQTARFCPEKPVSTFVQVGRLGNLLTSYANLLSVQLLEGHQLQLTEKARTTLDQFLENVPPANDSLLEMCKKETAVWENTNMARIFAKLDNCTVEDPCPAVTTKNLDLARISGRHFNFRRLYLEKTVHHLLKSNFQIKKKWTSKADRILRNLRLSDSEGAPLVGIHVRRKDYISFRQKLASSVVNETFFISAMDQMRRSLAPNKPNFLVVSDDLSWCAKYLSGPGVYLSPPGQDAMVDLSLLSLCSHSILDYGTFGMWGAIMAGGQTVVPRSALRVKDTNDDAWMNGWIILDGF